MIESIPRLLSGLLIGLAFGVFLQKGRVAKYLVIVRQLLLEDFTVVKIMATAVVFGGLGVYGAHALGLAELHIKPFVLGGVLLGGLCFGSGMALLGYCPGTTVAACGEGRRDAMVGLLGGLVGAGVYVAGYPTFHGFATRRDFGELTLPEVTGVPAFVWLLGLLALGAAVVAYRRHKRRRRGRRLRGPSSSSAHAH